MLKENVSLLLFILIICAGCSKDKNEKIDSLPPRESAKENVELTLVDPDATAETKALYSNLWRIQSEGFMFGHHDDLLYGREWKSEEGRSDVKEIVGDYPAVFSVDFAQIMDNRKDNNENLNDASTEDRRRTILEARNRGEVIMACAHLNNPLTLGDAWDNSKNTVIKEILEQDSEVNLTFRSWLDNLADFVSNLKDLNGNLIPIIFRPYHEHTQTWSWWGKGTTTEIEFIELWRFTIDYLKKEKGVHNLIYAISPQLDFSGTTSDLLFRWPGDDYVDFIGVDSYNGTNKSALSYNVDNLVSISEAKRKPVGITEAGIEGIVYSNGQEYTNYWTEQILNPIVGKNISMVVLWRNKFDPAHSGHHFFGPWIGHSSFSNFKEFYNSSFTLFSKDLPDMYKISEGVIVE